MTPQTTEGPRRGPRRFTPNQSDPADWMNMSIVVQATDRTTTPLEWAQYLFVRETRAFKADKSEYQVLRVQQATKTLVHEMLTVAPYLESVLLHAEPSDLVVLSDSLIKAQS